MFEIEYYISEEVFPLGQSKNLVSKRYFVMKEVLDIYKACTKLYPTRLLQLVKAIIKLQLRVY